MGCIPPIPDFNTGAPTCPVGYTYDPSKQLCCPNSTAPVDMGDPVVQKIVTGLGATEIDPAQAAKLGMEGVKASGVIERAVVAFFRAGITLVGPLLYEAASLIDDFLVVLSNIFFYAQGQRSSGYYLLVAALMEDLLGVQVDGAKLYNDFQAGGRLASMVDLGGSLFNTLAGEFTGVAQTGSSGAFSTAPGKGLAGLPDVQLSPTQGVDGARALLGFAASFAVREGNTDLLADYLPYGLGHWFKDFAEDFSKNLGLGRLMRIAMKPLVTTLVATPSQQAMNIQYRPTLLDAKQLHAAWNQGQLSSDQLKAALAVHGHSDANMATLQWEYLAKPNRAELREAHVTGVLADNDYSIWMHRIGYTDETIALLDAMEDIAPLRAVTLEAAKQSALSYLHGKVTKVQYESFIDAIKDTGNATPLLSPGEVAAFAGIITTVAAAPRRHLTVAQLMRDYEDGIIALSDFENALTAMGYSADDVTVFVQELLIASKRAADRAAKAAAAAARGPLAKLTVAQLETGYTSGLFTIDEISAELSARKYAPDAIAGLIAEFRIKAGLQTGTPPTT